MVKTHIQWTSHTWNPWHGCKKVSAGCKYCYMFRDKERYGQDPTTVLKSKTGFLAPYKIKAPSVIFTCSWSDFFIEEADAWRPEAWEIIKNTPQHQYQILTKRPERIKECLPPDWGDGYENVWLGVSGEDLQSTKKRLKQLLKVPAKLRFLSAEPLLENIINKGTIPLIKQLDWIIIGGESGNKIGKYKYRTFNSLWLKKILKIVKKYSIPCFVKQMGTHYATKHHFKDRHGGNPNEWAKKWRVREYPIDVSKYGL